MQYMIFSNTEQVEIVSLDEYFKESHIDFLKADIESYEMDMLCGAEKLIRRCHPNIAICIYHNASDMYQILLWLDNLDIGYKFDVRHHSVDYDELVLYAYL